MLNKEEYKRTVKRPYKVFFSTVMFQGVSNASFNEPFIEKKQTIQNIITSKDIYYYGIKDMESLGKAIYDNWIKPGRLDIVKQLYSELDKNFINSCNKSFEEYTDAFEKYMPALILVWVCDTDVENGLRTALEKKTSKENAEKLMHELNIPLEINYYKQEQFDLIKTTNLKEHAKKYEWIKARYGEINPYTEEDAKKKLSELNPEEFIKSYEEDKESVESAIKEAKEILGEKKHLVDLLQFIIFYRTQRTDIINMCIYKYHEKLEEYAKTKNISYKQLLYCTVDELRTTVPSKEIIDLRMKNHVIVLENGNLSCKEGEEAKKINEFIQPEINDEKEVRGTVACKGNVKGTVKIIETSADYKKIEKGDILITHMTTPEMVPILNLASAFITDEGGVTCHAAIFSREMDKPCIISTKIATEIFSDGDYVEVDANNGVVRKI